MAFGGLSVQRFDLFTGGFPLRCNVTLARYAIFLCVL